MAMLLPLLKLSLLAASVAICDASSLIYSAQCHSRCHSAFKDPLEAKSLSQCLTPCFEKDLGSCFNFCNSQQVYDAACHFSCKFIKILQNKDFLPGTCSITKIPDQHDCIRNKDCQGLTKCCYDHCQEISLLAKEITVTISNLTSSSLIADWQESNIANAVYIVQMRRLLSASIYYDDDDWDTWIELGILSQNTRIRLLGILPGTKLQLRLAVVNISGIQGIGPASPMVRTLFNASSPSGPATVWAITTETDKQDTVDVKLSWLPPEKLDIPVHRYRLFWREIPQITTDRVVNTKKQTRVEGSRNNYTISGLNKNKNYLVEIQAICLWKKKRLKGPKVAINVSTRIMKGTNQGKVEFVSNYSKFKRKHSNSSTNVEDDKFKGIRVILEEQKETIKATGNPSRKRGKGSANGSRFDFRVTMLLLLCTTVAWLI